MSVTTTSPDAVPVAEPTGHPRPATPRPDGRSLADPQTESAVGAPLEVPDGRGVHGTHRAIAVGDFDPSDFDQLRLFAECFEDTQKLRIAMSNRIGGAERRHVRVPPAAIEPALAAAELTEREWKKALVRCYRRVAPPAVREWQQGSFGIGEHLLARLLGVLGHPVVAFPHHWEGTGTDRVLVADTPYLRSVSQLWSYCGHGDPSRKRAKGMTADEAFALGNPRAKMLVWNLAVASMKRPSTAVGQARSETHTSSADGTLDHDPAIGAPKPERPTLGVVNLSDPARDATHTENPPPGRNYREVYDLGRVKYADREWTLGHQHAAALRLTGKEILRDLWVAGMADLET